MKILKAPKRKMEMRTAVHFFMINYFQVYKVSMIQFYMVKYSKVGNVIVGMNLENAWCYAVELRETGETLFKFTKKNQAVLNSD